GDVALHGSDQDVAPPDSQVGVGPTQVVLVVNSTMAVYDRSGTLLHSADLNFFYPMPTSPQGVRYSASDPRVFYDAASGRWFTSILGFDATNLTGSETFLAVSDSSDAAAGWSVIDPLDATDPRHPVPSNNGFLYDQPTMGVSDNLVVLTANAFSNVNT